jgi:hypothetical protein
MLQGGLEELTVDHAVEVVVEDGVLWLWALLNSVKWGTLSRDVDHRLVIRHDLRVAGAVGTVGRVVCGLISLWDGDNRAGH